MPDNVSENFERTDDDSDNSIFRRPVRTFVIRAGRLTTSERKSYDELHHVWCIPYEHKTLNYTEIFNNTNPVIMEIGFGMGHATSIIAENNPDINYIGSEVHVPGVGRLLGDIKTKQLKNLYIIEHDALEILETMIPDNSLAGFHIFFPDPWPKKKHHKRRMLQRPRTDLLAKKLAPGGYLYFATDWQEYAESALEELKMTEGLANKYEGYAPHQEWRPRTKFEQKGLDAGRDIYELFFVKE
ncbi:MAG: tRNA (guanosine(46)-N7)-methyltransferase TrmB [Spirochaetia bacterium]|uniref:tRNA (guanosine(46)-N7)-methyltransferase TrmB n=1 Tax=Treponema sp. TaxID=166 RepID=UPI00298D876A|nr:tRNA (guanosine(46)-N7)-methyltransferase TrmB [Treponema sp.]MCI7397113.1 tRNA (guanosine(46)-N7)-methyltransferase TrmB [Spirochaetia bacterium]MCI7577708.1 tRNA (guanosine(46)-N7)-methyltransferase TrmB [Spirochaetia bacterium]